MTQETNGQPTEIKPSAEQLAMTLREREQSRRPSRFVTFLVLLLLLAGPVVFLVWWFWPPPAPPAAMVVAFDAVGVPGEDIPLVARIEWTDPEHTSDSLSGWPVIFARDVATSTTEQDWSIAKKTDPHGMAATQHSAGDKSAIMPYVAVYAPEDKHTRAEDKGQRFCWPPETTLIFVDVKRSLTTANAETWATANSRDIPRNKEAASALDVLGKRKNYQIIYLDCEADHLLDFVKVRTFVQQIPQDDGKRFPSGPVLSTLSRPMDEDRKSACARVIGEVREKFQGKAFGVTSSRETASNFQAAGLQVFVIGQVENLPANVVTVESWSKLAEKLPQ